MIKVIWSVAIVAFAVWMIVNRKDLASRTSEMHQRYGGNAYSPRLRKLTAYAIAAVGVLTIVAALLGVLASVLS